MLNERGDNVAYGSSLHNTHISKILSMDEVREIMNSGEMEETESWVRHYDAMYGIDDEEIIFEDYPEANALLGEKESRRWCAADILSLNDSLTGFLRVLAYWVEAKDLFGVIVEEATPGLDNDSGVDAVNVVRMTLREEITDLMEEDIDDAAEFVYQITKNGIK